ncbi:exodeoxyribonuclease V subunit gamma [Vibrio sp. PP-XX7]
MATFVSRIPSRSELKSHYHRANLYRTFVGRLNTGDVSVDNLPKRLFIFGITALPPRIFDVLKKLCR